MIIYCYVHNLLGHFIIKQQLQWINLNEYAYLVQCTQLMSTYIISKKKGTNTIEPVTSMDVQSW